jgi:hypothetical protein
MGQTSLPIETQRRKVGPMSRFNLGAGSPQFGHALQQVGALRQRFVDRGFDGISNTVGHLNVLDAFHLKWCCG